MKRDFLSVIRNYETSYCDSISCLRLQFLNPSIQVRLMFQIVNCDPELLPSMLCDITAVVVTTNDKITAMKSDRGITILESIFNESHWLWNRKLSGGVLIGLNLITA